MGRSAVASLMRATPKRCICSLFAAEAVLSIPCYTARSSAMYCGMFAEREMSLAFRVNG